MCHKLVLVLCLSIISINAAPLEKPVVQSSKQPRQAQPQVIMHTLQQPIPVETYQPHTNIQTPQLPLRLRMEQALMLAEIQQQMTEEMQQIAMHQQILALQQMQGLHEMKTVHGPPPMILPQPILILLPNESTDNNNHEPIKKTNDIKLKENGFTHEDEYDNEGLDSITDETQDHHKVENGMRKAVLLLPDPRFSIGGIISAIPWLPWEVNVPDTVIWAWNGISSGISGIISIIGNRLPFRPNQKIAAVEPSVKMFLKQLQNNNFSPMMPAYVLPAEDMVPVNVPVHFNV